MNRSILENKIQEEANWLVGQIRPKSDSNAIFSDGINPKMLLAKAVNNVISGLVFGAKCSLDEHFEENIANIDTMMQNCPTTLDFFIQACIQCVGFVLNYYLLV